MVLIYWEMTLSSGGAELTSQLTGSDGCISWGQLLPGKSYAVRETLKPGWKALAPVSHDFGVVPSGADPKATFINALNQVFIYVPLVMH